MLVVRNEQLLLGRLGNDLLRLFRLFSVHNIPERLGFFLGGHLNQLTRNGKRSTERKRKMKLSAFEVKPRSTEKEKTALFGA